MMRNTVNKELRETVERYVRQRFADTLVDEVIVYEGLDEDDDPLVEVIVVLTRDEEVTGFSSLARNLWTELSRKDFGFPILSFRTREENQRVFAAA